MISLYTAQNDFQRSQLWSSMMWLFDIRGWGDSFNTAVLENIDNNDHCNVFVNRTSMMQRYSSRISVLRRIIQNIRVLSCFDVVRERPI